MSHAIVLTSRPVGQAIKAIDRKETGLLPKWLGTVVKGIYPDVLADGKMRHLVLGGVDWAMGRSVA